MNESANVIEFWFGDSTDTASTIAGRQSALWWRKNPAVDAMIAKRFGALVKTAATGRLHAWAATPEGRLALILVTDQFPRNIHRDTPRAFALDPLARKFCLEGLDRGDDAGLDPLKRVFFYLPLEHSERADDQARCVELMRALARDATDADKPVFDDFVEFALAHQRVIDRFGRFPHRNRILGRDSTPEEIEFLKQPGSSF
ncbi:MAG: DUF924 family protein [Wenzhouxiangellaceae bacterium]|nr:DUF924 family protein [Wenzhouxiangellaceae bacterium]